MTRERLRQRASLNWYMLAFLGAALLSLCFGAFVVSRPATIPDRAPPEIQADRTAFAGWRQGPDGTVLVTPSPDGGVVVYRRDAVWFETTPQIEALSAWPLVENPPYRVFASSARAPDGTFLAATVFMPPSPTAGAVIVHGSGESTRDNAWYLDLADRLARSGVVVWFPDKRGAGASGGQWQTASFETLAEDAVAGRAALAEMLRAADVVVPLGYVGVSQGGWIAPIAAQREPTSFVVALSAAAVSPNEQLDHEVRADLQRELPAALVSIAMPVARALPRWRYPEFWRSNGGFDPVAAIVASRAPTLVVFGDEDEADNIPVALSLQRLQQAQSLGADVEVIIVEGGGHDLSPGDGVGPIEPGAMTRIEAFIASHP